MSESTLINGWSIKQGDYLRDPDYDEQFIKNNKKKVLAKKTVFSIAAVVAVGAFVGLMNLMTHLIK
jgi:hypothetical protein